MLRTDTLKLIDAFRQAELFAHVGEPLDDAGVTPAGSWREACKLALGKKWYNIRLEAQNQLTAHLDRHFTRQYQRWNDIVYEVNPLLIPTLDRALERVAPAHGLKPRARFEFDGSVKVDCGGACSEVEYGDLVPPGFYLELAQWYLRGRLPCGWDGPWPEGRLIVF